MRRLAATSILVLFFPASAASLPQTAPDIAKPLVYSDREGYAVLSYLIQKRLVGSSKSPIDISLATDRGECPGCAECLNVPDEFQSAKKDFREKNKSSMRLANEFSLKVKYTLTDKPDVVTLPRSDPNEQQPDEKSVPKTLFSVSAVGFDISKTHAIAYVSAYCGVMCAGGAYYPLIKDKNEWKEVPESPRCKWVSQIRSLADRGISL